MAFTFKKYFEQYENYHSFVDMVNLVKEIKDYAYNNDIINSKFFDNIVETKNGYTINFNRNDSINYYINTKTQKVTDFNKAEQNIDKVYEDMETLFMSIKNEFVVNIKQIDEIVTFKKMFINESFEDELLDKLSEDYKNLKKGVLELLDNTLNGEIEKIQNFVDEYIKEDSTEILEKFVEPAEIFEFYLKYQTDVDQILKDNDYYDDVPDINSLYDYVIDGTFEAVILCMKEIQKELYKGEE